jgi:N4-gp56 family major capsid protein
MADVLTGLTEVAGTIESLVQAEIQMVLNAAVVVPGSIQDLSPQVGPGMDRVALPRLAKFTVNTKVENVAVDAQAVVLTSDLMILDQYKVVQFLMEDIADLQSKVNVTQAGVKQVGMDLAAELDSKLLTDIAAGTSAAAPDHRIAYANASTIAKADVLAARELLNLQNVPASERTLIVSPGSEADLLSIAEFTRVDESGGSAALRNGQIGKLFGFDVLVSSQALDLKSLAYHKTAHAYARQLQPFVESQRQVEHLATRWSISHIYASKHLDSGKRAVMLGTAA